MKVTIISSDRRNRLRSLRSKTKKVGLNSSSVAANSALIYLNYFHVTEIHHSVGSEIQNPARDKGAMPTPLKGRPGPLRAPVEGLDGAHCPSGCHTQKRFAPEALGTGRAPCRLQSPDPAEHVPQGTRARRPCGQDKALHFKFRTGQLSDENLPQLNGQRLWFPRMVVQARLPAEERFLGASGQIPSLAPGRQALPDELRSAFLIRTEMKNPLKLCGIQWEWPYEAAPRWQLQGWPKCSPRKRATGSHAAVPGRRRLHRSPAELLGGGPFEWCSLLWHRVTAKKAFPL